MHVNRKESHVLFKYTMYIEIQQKWLNIKDFYLNSICKKARKRSSKILPFPRDV